MGNSGPSKMTTVISEMNFLSKKQDPRYGRILLYQHKTTTEIFALKQLLLKSAAEFKRDIDILTARCLSEHPGENTLRIHQTSYANLIRVIAYSTHNEDSMCSSFYTIDVVTEYLERDLETEINERKEKGEAFSEKEIWFLLQCLISALGTLHQMKAPVGDLTPAKVLISKEKVYKLVDPALMSIDSIPGYFQRLMGGRNGKISSTYLSPQLLGSLAQNLIHPQHDVFKSDVFALGLTALHAATLDDCDDLYDWKTKTFSYESLHVKIDSLRGNYSARLVEFISRLLEQEEESRPNLAQLQDELGKFVTIEEPVSYEKITPGVSVGQEYTLVTTFKQRGEQRKLQSGAPIKEIEEEQEEPVKELLNPIEVQSRRLSEELNLDNKSEVHNKYMIETPQKYSPLATNTRPMVTFGNAEHEYSEASLNHPQHESPKYGLNSTQGFKNNSPKYLHEKIELQVQQQQSSSKITHYTPNKKRMENPNLTSADKSANIYSYNSNSVANKMQTPSEIRYSSNAVLYPNQDKDAYLSEHQSPIRYSSPEKFVEEYRLKSPLNGTNSVTSPVKKNENPVDVDKVIEGIKAKSNYTYTTPRSYRDGSKPEEIPDARGSNNFQLSQGLSEQQQKIYQPSPQNKASLISDYGKKDSSRFNYDANSPQKSVNGQYSERAYVKQYSPQKCNILDISFLSNQDFYSFFSLSDSYPFFFSHRKLTIYSFNFKLLLLTDDLDTMHRAEPLTSNYVTESYTDGSLYEGQIRNDKKHGRGRFYFTDGSMYEGDWDNDSMHGVGTLYYASGKIAYEGKWYRDRFHGRGTVYNEYPAEMAGEFNFKNFDELGNCWVKYNGDFVHDVKCGFGELYLSNGDKLSGNFRDDMVNGKANYIFANGQSFKAEWLNNRMLEH